MVAYQRGVDGMNKKQTLFVDYYLQSFNASDAARKAGYSEKTAYSIGHELLRKPEISEAIQARLSDVHMNADEALKLLTDIARGDMAQMMDISSVGFSLDMSRAKELGLTRLIKKVKQRTVTHLAKNESDEDREVIDLEVELYDALGAIRDILKVHGKFVDKFDINQNGTTKVIIEYADSIEDTNTETAQSATTDQSEQEKI